MNYTIWRRIMVIVDNNNDNNSIQYIGIYYIFRFDKSCLNSNTPVKHHSKCSY